MCIDKKELIEYMTTSMIFDETTLNGEGLTSKIWHRYLLQSSGKKVRKSGECILRVGENTNGCYLVKKGRLKNIFINKDGMTKTILIIGEGGIFGEQFIFHNQPSLLEATVISDAELYFFPKEAIVDLCQKDFQISFFIMNSLSMKFRILAAQLEDMSLRNTFQNICRTLYSFCCYEENNGQSENAIILHLTHEDLANMLGVHRVTITKNLNKLKTLRVLEYKYEKITVLNSQRLKKYAFE